MDATIRTFFEHGRRFRMNRGKGGFLLLENESVVSSVLKKYISIENSTETYTVSKIKDAIFYLNQSLVKCALIDMSVEGSIELLRQINNQYPKVVCIIYGGDEDVLRMKSLKYNRVVVICNSNNLRNLMDSIINQIESMEKRKPA